LLSDWKLTEEGWHQYGYKDGSWHRAFNIRRGAFDVPELAMESEQNWCVTDNTNDIFQIRAIDALMSAGSQNVSCIVLVQGGNHHLFHFSHSLHGWQVIFPAFLVELLQLLGML
jgi:hypothetical protein